MKKEDIEKCLNTNVQKAYELTEEYIKLYPEKPYGYLLKGHILYKVKPLSDECLIHYKKGVFISLKTKELSEISSLFNELGIYYKSRQNVEEALINFYLSLEYARMENSQVRPMIHFNLATTLLTNSNYIEGFEEYRWLYIDRDTYLRHFSQPFWAGEERLNDTIYIHNEQAFGDLMFYFRYIRHLKPYFKKIIIEIPKKLIKLFTSSQLLLIDPTDPNSGKDPQFLIYPRVDGNNPGIKFDVHTHFALLPHLFKTTVSTIPTKDLPYFKSDNKLVKKWQKYFAKKVDNNKFKIAINWCGKPTNEHEHKRKIPLEKFLKLDQGNLSEKIQLVSVQKNFGLDQLKPSYPIINLDPIIDISGDAFTDTLAIMETVDLVITSDTAIAHLAGCLGKMVWVLLPYEREWRWLKDRSDSPWYPKNMRLFTQPKAWDWDSVFEEVVQEVQKLI